MTGSTHGVWTTRNTRMSPRPGTLCTPEVPPYDGMHSGHGNKQHRTRVFGPVQAKAVSMAPLNTLQVRYPPQVLPHDALYPWSARNSQHTPVLGPQTQPIFIHSMDGTHLGCCRMTGSTQPSSTPAMRRARAAASPAAGPGTRALAAAVSSPSP